MAANVTKFRKIGQDGALLPDDATEWVAVLDTTTKLMWALVECEELPWKMACEFPSTLSTAGCKDWRMPTVDELFMLADRSSIGPAIDTAFFPECKNGCYWSSTPFASPKPHSAWFVDFDVGLADWSAFDEPGFVRAVRDNTR